ncbi:hypothetical protein OH76DRAFT_943091 [Lentinus brumalis]|uniref:Uncharacterized protein n=1 Tax=Lentinus brumalis TaxID=2498619 RepID=A0A371CZJ9_9APHY|nr:hypothetical protein OH76DRAFT_943091 [Polyporus brumalis]
MSVVWASKTSALATIEESRGPLLPKAVPPIQFISSNLHLLMQDSKPARSAKRKLPSADVDDGQPVAKRLRTRIAKPKVPAGPPRKSTRLRKSGNTAASANLTLANETGGAEDTATGGAKESVDVDADVAIDVETVEEAPAQEASGPAPKKRATTKTTPRRKATSARKGRAPKKTAVSATPKQAVEQVPQEAAASSSRRVENPASAPSSSDIMAAASSLLMLASVAASSAPTTAVGTPVEGSTCVNTPSVAAQQPPIELTKVDAKLAAPGKASGRRSGKGALRPPAKAPERTSARIREKKAGAGSVQGA